MTTAPTSTKTVSLAIKAEPEAVWAALTDASISPAYYYGFSIESDFQSGSDYVYTAGGMPMITGRVEDISPGKTVTMTFNGAWDPAVAALPESTVTYSLDAPAMPIPGVTVLNMTHEGMPEGETADGVGHGWVLILSGLKTLVETGAPLAAAPGA